MRTGLVIYTRTANYDYSHDFAIRPQDMPDPATYHECCTNVFQIVSHSRRIIRFMIGDRKGCMCGIAAISTEFLSKDENYRRYQFVDDCREYRFLCGVYSEKPFLPSIDSLVSSYVTEIERIWDSDTHSGSIEPISNDCEIAEDASDAEKEWAHKCSKKLRSWLFGRKIKIYTFDIPSDDEVNH